jgi:hypothetical protein
MASAVPATARNVPALLQRFRVTVNGSDISPALAPILNRMTIRDAAGATADTAEIELDDAGGKILLPKPRASMRIELQDVHGFGLAFAGKVDELHSRGSRSGGRILTISAKGADVLGRVKQVQERHFDNTTIGEALAQAAQDAGITDMRVDPALAQISRPYLALESESFLAFGQRMAREVGGTFKIIDTVAVLVKRNGGTTASGKPLGSVSAVYGQNLIEWDIAPFVSRSRHKRARSRHYDTRAGRLVEQTADVDDDSTDAELVVRYNAADDAAAQDQANASAGEISRAGGSGSVTIDGDTSAKSEAVCSVSGTRDGIDGDYRIDTVEHTLDAGGGLVTRIELGQPHGKAGKDSRKTPLQTLKF